MDAALVASVGEVEMHSQRNAQLNRPGVHFGHQELSTSPFIAGWSLIRMIPNCASA
jgi:hypothetical protein